MTGLCVPCHVGSRSFANGAPAQGSAHEQFVGTGMLTSRRCLAVITSMSGRTPCGRDRKEGRNGGQCVPGVPLHRDLMRVSTADIALPLKMRKLSFPSTCWTEYIVRSILRSIWCKSNPLTADRPGLLHGLPRNQCCRRYQQKASFHSSDNEKRR